MKKIAPVRLLIEINIYLRPRNKASPKGWGRLFCVYDVTNRSAERERQVNFIGEEIEFQINEGTWIVFIIF
jgi:hypothetical protein